MTNAKSIKESDDPESTKDFSVVLRRELVVRESMSESGLERADV